MAWIDSTKMIFFFFFLHGNSPPPPMKKHFVKIKFLLNQVFFKETLKCKILTCAVIWWHKRQVKRRLHDDINKVAWQDFKMRYIPITRKWATASVNMWDWVNWKVNEAGPHRWLWMNRKTHSPSGLVPWLGQLVHGNVPLGMFNSHRHYPSGH